MKILDEIHQGNYQIHILRHFGHVRLPALTSDQITVFPEEKAALCIKDKHPVVIKSDIEIRIKPLNPEDGIVLKKVMKVPLQNSSNLPYFHHAKAAPFLTAICTVCTTEVDARCSKVLNCNSKHQTTNNTKLDISQQEKTIINDDAKAVISPNPLDQLSEEEKVLKDNDVPESDSQKAGE